MVILFWRFRALFIPPLDQEFGEITAAIYMDVYSNIIVAPFHAAFSIKRTNGSDLAIKSLIWKDQKIREVSGSFAADPELHLALNEEIRPWQHARSFRPVAAGSDMCYPGLVSLRDYWYKAHSQFEPTNNILVAIKLSILSSIWTVIKQYRLQDCCNLICVIFGSDTLEVLIKLLGCW